MGCLSNKNKKIFHHKICDNLSNISNYLNINLLYNVKLYQYILSASLNC